MSHDPFLDGPRPSGGCLLGFLIVVAAAAVLTLLVLRAVAPTNAATRVVERNHAPPPIAAPVTTTTEAPAPPPSTTTTVTTTPAVRRSVPPAAQYQVAAGGDCDRPSTCPALRVCENGGTYANKGDSARYAQAFQFDRETWVSNGGDPNTYGSASPEEQDRVADDTYARRGSAPWPSCGRYLRR